MHGSLSPEPDNTTHHNSGPAKEKHSPLHSRQRMARRWQPRILVSVLWLLPSFSTPAQTLAQKMGARSGHEIYLAACSACHAEAGGGAPESQTLFVRPDSFPHFDRCDETTPESTRDWTAIVRDGGAARGFSRIMPAFKEVLNAAEINRVVSYLRGLCTEQSWPRGELNVPRALVTEKAFPESETVLTTSATTSGPAAAMNELAYEKTLGRRDQLEIAAPFGWVRQPSGALVGGLGDLAVGVKHVLFSQLHTPSESPVYDATGSILSLQVELTLPTGNPRAGLGTGVFGTGVFLAYDAVLPGQSFVQLQGGTDLPFSTRNGPRSVYLRSALGKSFSEHEFGRMWSPMVEFVGTRDLTGGAVTDWDLVPEFQVTLNRRQHIRAAIGYDMPVTDTAGRPREIMAYFLWDWFDGGFAEGWR
jgi:mono/diheme cytochrome c family protein